MKATKSNFCKNKYKLTAWLKTAPNNKITAAAMIINNPMQTKSADKNSFFTLFDSHLYNGKKR